MTSSRSVLMLIFAAFVSVRVSAQPPPPPPAAPPPPPPLWDTQIGASFVGTSGNSDTSSLGADFGAHRRGLTWQIESSATAVRTSSDDRTTAERYLGQVRVQRKLTPILGVSVGEK